MQRAAEFNNDVIHPERKVRIPDEAQPQFCIGLVPARFLQCYNVHVVERGKQVGGHAVPARGGGWQPDIRPYVESRFLRGWIFEARCNPSRNE